MFFTLQSVGFLLAGVAMIAMLCHRQKETAVMAAAAPAAYKGTFIFVGLMAAGFGMMNGSLCALSKKLKKPGLSVFFVYAFVSVLVMGYLSSKDFGTSAMNWVAQGINLAGQGAFLTGTILAHKFGLAKLKLHGGEEV